MQKVVNNHLYVFDLTPFEITENTDASVIFVQNECVEGYKELNSDVADKIQGFNQFLLCVQKQEWSMPADPVDGGLEWSASTATVRIGDTNSYPTLINPNELEVTYSSSNESVATIDSTGAITLVGPGSTTITAAYAGGDTYYAQSVSYTLTVEAAQQETGHTLRIEGYDLHSHIDVYFNSELQDLSGAQLVDGVPVIESTAIKITLKEGLQPEWFSVLQGVEWDDNEQAWVATMPDYDYTIQIDYNGDPQQ